VNREQNKEHYFSLSLSQHNILNLEYAFPGTSINNISTTIRINGQLDFPLLQESINLVLKNDASLRTRLILQDGEVLQYYAPYCREDFPVFDFGNTSQGGLENWETAVTRECIPLWQGALYRFVLFHDGEGSGGVLVKLHHIIADGWSQIMICNRIGQTYLELLEGKVPNLIEVPDYELHVQEEQAYLKSKAYSKDEEYWRNIVESSGEPSVLKAVSSAAVSPVGRRISFELPQILNHAIYSYCLKKRVAPFAVFYMALAIYFKRIGGADQFTIGVPIFNRTNYQFKQSTGMFVTTLPFFNEINDEWSLNQFNEELMEKWFEMLRHQRYPFTHISALAGGEGRLFNIALSYQDSKIFESKDASVKFTGRWHYCGYQAEQLTIHLTNLMENKRYEVDYDYLAQFFTEEEIKTLHNGLCQILFEALTEPDKPIHQLRILSFEEEEQLLYTFNRTERYLENKSVYEALICSCSEYQNRVAAICDGERMTYAALLHRSNCVASALMLQNIKKDNLVAVLLPRKFDLLSSMVGCMQIECGFMILSQELPGERIRHILKQSEASILLTDRKGRNKVGKCSLPVFCVEEIKADTHKQLCSEIEHSTGKSVETVSERLAYVVYTSGSTGEPKGVEITQRNLLNLSQEMEHVYGKGAVLSVCNVGFDAFMLESIVALLNGRTIVLPSDEDLESPERLAVLINSHAVGFFSMTPSRLNALIQNAAFSRVMWKIESIVCGGEAFPQELLKKLKKITNARIYNQYGPSEATVGVSIKELSGAERITAGKPMGNCRLYVLDKWMNPLPVGGYGNLYIGGECVGRGYRKQPELTAQYFLESPFVTGERIYNTGDMAGWTADGEIMLAGRTDSQVKLRGLRVELQEVVSCMESFPGVISAAAKVCEMSGQPVLGGYYSSAKNINEAELLSHLATYLPRYMIPAFLMKLSQIPMGASGKVDERRLPAPQDNGEHRPVRLSETAEVLVSIFRRVLNKEEVHGGSDYFLVGGNSLNAMECIMEIEEQLGRRIRIADLYACRNAVRLAAFLTGDMENSQCVQETMDSEGFFKAPASKYMMAPVQQGMYVQSLLDPDGISYNMPGAFLLKEKPDKQKLQNAFEEIIKQDAILRTVFVHEEGNFYARVLEQVSFQIEELEAQDIMQACRGFLRPFDLGKAPLLRAGLLQLEDEWYLFVDMHHIIGDGMSTPLILKRLDQAYSGESFTVEWNYYDYLYTVQKRSEEFSEKSQLEYWVGQLQQLPEPLQLQGDYIRPKTFDFRGSEYEVILEKEDCENYKNFCKENGISEFTLFLSAYAVLLSAISGRTDFVIGVPAAGRTLPQTLNICGPFINTLPLRMQPLKELTVLDWVNNVQAQVAGMLDHQNISLEEIIQELELPRGTQNALYQVMMTQSPVDEESFMLNGKHMQYVPISSGSVKMDLIVEIAKKKEHFALRFSYATSIFSDETIRFYGRCFENILQVMIKAKDTSLGQLKILPKEDHFKYIEEPNYKVTPFVNLPIHKLVENKAKGMEKAAAVIYHGEEISFLQIEKRASAIAGFLDEKNVKPGQCVGLCLSRTPDMVASMYAVLKAGCSYMFMLPTFPAARLQYMLEISEAAIVLCDQKAKDQLPGELFGENRLCNIHLLPEGDSGEYISKPVSSEQIANVLFTSGSTGKPKGVMLRHRSLSNLCSQMKTLLDPVTGTVLCSTNSVFDCFIVETLIALALGKTVVLADEEEMMLPWKLAELMEKHQTGILEMTPSRLQMCLGNDVFCKAARNIRIVLLGGEVVTNALLQQFYAHSEGVLMNMYGPTEATVFTTMTAVGSKDHITVGKPLQNTRVYVLDEDGKPVLPTACGELYIAGECLAAGYINRPDLTDSSFVEDIYFPGEKMYRTGDLVRLRLDGNFDFIGRKDTQVKLNGQRVELSEITGAIMESGHASQAATVAVRKQDHSMELCAFYESNSAENSQEEILTHLQRVLPAYMIPSHIRSVEKMPMTATNKIDMCTLEKMALEGLANISNSNELEQPVPEKVTEIVVKHKEKETSSGEMMKTVVEVTPSYILSVWNRVLTVPAENPEVSFFKQGGTSLGALSVLSYFYNDHLEMSLSDFYENPTALQQAKFFVRTKQQKENADSVKMEPGILVTGATGFLGAHLVKALLDEEKKKIFCLLRDGEKQRLQECFVWYFGQEILTAMKGRLEIVKGDISLEKLGMGEAEYSYLADKVSEIYHCAADVRHYAAEEDSYMKTNVGGTANMLAFAETANAVFYHMSTCSVGGEQLKEETEKKTFTEKDLDIGQIWEKNIYVKSKFLAEELVLQAAQKGLEVKIFRLGRLVGRASDGVFQKNPQTNAFYLLMKGFCELGAMPQSAANMKVDLMPIDISIEEILVLRSSNERSFHIMSHNPPMFKEIAEAFGERIRIVNDFEFMRMLDEKSYAIDRELLAMLLNYWHSIRWQKHNVAVTNELTMKELSKAGYNPQIPSAKQILKGFQI